MTGIGHLTNALQVTAARLRPCLNPNRAVGQRQVSGCVIAPRKAWRLLQGESPGRVRGSHPPVSRLASMAESWLGSWRTRWAKRRQRILEAVGGAASPEVLVPLRHGSLRTPRVVTLPKATRPQPLWQGCVGPPESSGHGMQAERRRSTGEAPEAPGRPGRQRSTVTGKACRMRLRSRIERSTRRWGKPTTGGRSRRKHGARKGHASRTGRTGVAGANLPAGHSKQGASWQRFSPARTRVQPRNRMREHCTSGSARGASGNRRPYRGDVKKKRKGGKQCLRISKSRAVACTVPPTSPGTTDVSS